MPKPRSDSGRKNLISENLIELRRQHGLSQRDLARELQIHGCDMDKNVITRIETQKRYVKKGENLDSIEPVSVRSRSCYR